MKNNQMKFKMTISKINVIKVGSVLSGKIEKGEITVGDKIEFGGVDGKQELEIKGIADNDTRKRIEKAGKGKNVGLLVVEKNCEQMGLQEGITVYIAEEETQEEYFSDLFGELEEEKIEEDKSNNKKNSENQAVIRVVVIYSDKLESISVDGIKMKDISAIKNMPIPSWFSGTEDRNGWEGLITEIRKMLDDNSVDLSFEFHGPQESKYIFEECISKRGFGNNEISKETVAKENLQEAKRKEHRGLYNEAFKDYLQAADFGELEEAQFKVGEYYYAYCEGESKADFSLSEEEAIAQTIKYYELAANKGNADAQYGLYTIFYEGIYVEENYEEAFKWGMMAAKQGHADAEYGVAEAYQYGNGVKIDYKEAVKWYEKAADQRLTEALTELGYDYKFGNMNLSINYGKSFAYYIQAAQKGDVAGQANIAEFYMEGKGIEKNEEEALKWYRKAAEQGDADSEYAIGQYYECDRNDIKLAIEWYKKAAEQGHVDAQIKMKNCYGSGKGLKKDLTQAFEWAEKAAEQGDAQAQCYLGRCYKDGLGVEADKNTAIEWYKKAAEQGDAEAQCELGKCYDIFCAFNKLYIKKNEEKALEWYKKARDQGYSEAQYRYGNAYRYYSGNSDIGARYRIAEAWIKKAADNKNPCIEACLDIADGHYAMMDEHGERRKKALVGSSLLAGLGAVVTVPVALAENAVIKSVKVEKFLKTTDEGKEMMKYYRKAAALGSEKAKKRIKEIENY